MCYLGRYFTLINKFLDELKPESSEPAITSQSPESERDSSSPIEEVQLSTFNLVLFGLPNLVFA